MPPISNITGKAHQGPKIRDDYHIGAVLGRGAFGTVYVAKDRKTGEVFAAKSISKAKLVCAEDAEDVQREMEVLNLVSDHGNVAALQATYEDSECVYFVLELCKGGELFDRIVSKGTFSERMAAEYFRTMVEVVSHCHQLGVIHRDIKPENWLLTTPDDTAVLKAADFGLSTYFRPGQRFDMIVGSAYYVAPEVLRRNYSHQADMWSLGVILYILMSGMPPFWGDTEEDIFKMILRGKVDFNTQPWPSISVAAKDLITRLLERDPARRATAQDVLQHPWLKEQGVASDKPLDNVVIQRMKQFAAMNKLKKAALLFMAKSLSAEELQGLQHLFKSIDTDNSGTITVNELREAFFKLGNKVGDEELEQLMKAADVDGNGTIDYEEFLACTVNLSKLEKEEYLAQAFKHFDTDHDGTISKEEIQKALATQSSAMSEGEILSLIQEHDTNQDGLIDYQEFLTMMRAGKPELKEAASFLRGLRSPSVNVLHGEEFRRQLQTQAQARAHP